METALRFSGYIGAVLFGFGVLGAYIVGSFTAQPLIVLQLVLGALFLVLWAVTSGLQGVSKASQVIAGRQARFGYNVALYSLVFIGLLVVGNIFVVNNDSRWDLTEQGVHSLSEKSINLVAGLKKPLKLVAIDTSRMLTPGGATSPEKTRELLGLYKYHNPKQVSFEVIDPRANPVEIDRLGMKQGNLLYLEYGGGSESAISRVNTVDEQSITNAIIKLTKGASKKFYYVEGHGEPELASQSEEGMKSFVDALANEHVTVEGLLLPQVGKIPDDAAGVMVAAPKKAFQEAERQALIQYAQGGGRLILLNNGEDVSSEEIRTLAKAFAIEVGRDVILDAESQLFTGGPQVFMAMSYSPHPITAKLSGRQPPVFSFASSVIAPTSKESGVTFTEILKSGRNSWAERDLARLFDQGDGKASFGAEDLKGPVPIAVAYEKKLATESGADSSKVSRVVVFGDATWLRNDSLGSAGNQDLALNVVNWAVGEEGSVAIGPKRMRRSDAIISQTTYDAILAFSFLGPEILLLLGLFVWWKRQTSHA
jgi:hypothetical protein